MSDEPDLLRFEDVSLHFDETPALDHVSFELKPGETRILLGAAGSGKTMLLKSAVGLVTPDSGQVLLFNQDVTTLKESELIQLRSRVGILFQEGGLFDSLTIEENVGYPLENQASMLIANKRLAKNGSNFNGSSSPAAVSEETTEERVREALRFVELELTMDKFPNELSGGMRRRVGIARAVVTEPPLVLYDSPTAGLDPITANTIISLIIQQRDLRNTATIMVTHRYQDGHMLANFRYNPSSGTIEASGSQGQTQRTTKFMVMKEGRLVFEGSESELRRSGDPYVQKFAKPGSA